MAARTTPSCATSSGRSGNRSQARRRRCSRQAVRRASITPPIGRACSSGSGWARERVRALGCVLRTILASAEPCVPKRGGSVGLDLVRSRGTLVGPVSEWRGRVGFVSRARGRTEVRENGCGSEDIERNHLDRHRKVPSLWPLGVQSYRTPPRGRARAQRPQSEKRTEV